MAKGVFGGPCKSGCPAAAIVGESFSRTLYSYNMMHACMWLLTSSSLSAPSLPPFFLSSSNCAISCCCSVVGTILAVFFSANWERGRERDCGILEGEGEDERGE